MRGNNSKHGDGAAPSGAAVLADIVEPHVYLESMLAALPEAIIAIDADRHILHFNTAAERMFCYRAEDVLGRSIEDLLPPRFRAGHKAHVERFMRGDVAGRAISGRTEIAGLRADGEEFPTESLIVKTGVGDKIVITVILSDITSRYKRDAELRESETRYRGIIENMSDIMYRADMDGNLLMVSPAVEEILGYTPYELVGRQIAEFYVEPDRRKAFLADLEANGGFIRNARMALRHSDGSSVWVETNAQYFHDESGNLAGIEGTARDITELRNSTLALHENETRFRALVDNLPAAVTLKNAAGRLEVVNRAFLERYGLTPDSIVGQTLDKILSAGNQELVVRADADIFAGRSNSFTAEIEVDTATLGKRTVHLAKFPVMDISGARISVGTISTDVTAAKQARDALAASEALFRALVDNMPHAVNLKDRDGRFTLVNQAFSDIFGEPGETLIGKTLTERFSENSWTNLLAADELILSGQADVIETEQVVRPGEADERIFHVVKFPVVDADGNRVGVGALATDNTERKTAQETVEKSEALFRGIIENMADVFYRIDSRDRLTMVSPSVIELLGYTPDELIGSRSIDLYAAPEDQVALAAELAGHNGKIRNFQVDLRRKDGGLATVLTSGQIYFDEQGQEAGVEGTLRDITEFVATQAALRASESRFRTLLDNMPNPVALKDGEGRYDLVNAAFEKLYGSDSEHIIGTMAGDHFPTYDWSEMERIDAAIAAGEQSHFETEIEFEKDGALRHHHIVKFPVIDSDGRRLNVGTIATDITERRRADEMLRQSQKMEVVGQLTGGIAHDFNNLLAVALANIDLAFDVVDEDSPAIPFLRRIAQVSERGAALTQRLLAFSRQQSLQPQLTDISELILGMADLMNRTLGENVEIDFKIKAGLRHCRVDRAQLENAILNLAVNARDAMPHGGTLSIRAKNVEIGGRGAVNLDLAAGRYVLIRVRDTGAGMSREVIERAFEPFFTTKEVGKGSGLGLSMVYGFARQSGGDVVIHSPPGMGTRVSIYLPVEDGVESAESIEQPTMQPINRLTGSGENILVVEDDPGVRLVTTTILSALGYNVTEATSVDEALPLLTNGAAFDLLLTDVVLPGSGDGYQLAQQVARDKPGVKIVLMSGFANDKLEGQVKSDPHMVFLRKPYRKLELAQLIRDQLTGAPATLP